MLGGEGFRRLKFPIGLRKLPDSWGISENFLVCGDAPCDFDELSEHIVKLLVDSIEYEVWISLIGVGGAGVISTFTSIESPVTEGEWLDWLEPVKLLAFPIFTASLFTALSVRFNSSSNLFMVRRSFPELTIFITKKGNFLFNLPVRLSLAWQRMVANFFD